MPRTQECSPLSFFTLEISFLPGEKIPLLQNNPPDLLQTIYFSRKKRFFFLVVEIYSFLHHCKFFCYSTFIVSGRELVILEYTHYHYIHNAWQVIPFSGMWVNNSFTYRKNYLQTYKATYILLYVSISILGGMLSRNLM